MSSTTASRLLGRTFVNPAFDYLAVGGGLSMLLTALLAAGVVPLGHAVLTASLPSLLFFGNIAHFAGSTVRLYTKRGSFESLPFVTMALPLLTVAALSAAIWQPALGRHLLALYLTWSPFHYAAQTYGLALMYCYRSGSTPSDAQKLQLRVTSLAPFVYSFLSSPDAGLAWFVPEAVLARHATLQAALSQLALPLALASLALPLGLFASLLRRGPAMPLICVTLTLSNGLWWVTLPYLGAFAWSTVFHSLQYLAIVLVFHVRERMARPENRGGWLHHAARFYGACLLLGYGLFQVWPLAYVAAGFGWAESVLLVTAVINIHHFVVDAYIWRLRRDSNYRVVMTGLATAPAA